MKTLSRHPGHTSALRLEEVTLDQQVVLFDFERGILGVYRVTLMPFVDDLGYLSIEFAHQTSGVTQQQPVADLGLCSYDEHSGVHQQISGWPSSKILVKLDDWNSLPFRNWMPRLTYSRLFEL